MSGKSNGVMRRLSEMLRNEALKMLAEGGASAEKAVALLGDAFGGGAEERVKRRGCVVSLARLERDGQYELLTAIKSMRGYEAQVNEWRRLGLLKGEVTRDTLFSVSSEISHLYIDTEHFPELFEVLDKTQKDGVVVKGDNLRVMRSSLLSRYNRRAKLLYADPPFCEKQEAWLPYNASMSAEEWTLFFAPRAIEAAKFVAPDGAMAVKCDYTCNYIVRYVLNDIFGRKHFVNEIVCRRAKKPAPKVAQRLTVEHDNILIYRNSDKFRIYTPLAHVANKKNRWGRTEKSIQCKQQKSNRIIRCFGVTFTTDDEHYFPSQNKIDTLEKKGRLRLKCRQCKYIHTEGKLEENICPNCHSLGSLNPERLYCSNTVNYGTLWNDIPGVSLSSEFSSANSLAFAKRLIEMTTSENDLVMDIFAGSGILLTTAMAMNRRWVGIEQAEKQFHEVIIPAMKKATSKSLLAWEYIIT